MTPSAILRVSTMRLQTPNHRPDRREFVEWELRSGNVAEVVNIVVDDRRQGVGSSLVTEMCRMLRTSGVRTVYAWTRGSNLIAQAFWESCGFDQFFTVGGFYADGETAEERTGVFYVRAL